MEDFVNRQVRVFGHSIPLVFLLLIIFVGAAIAGIFASMQLGLEGNIREVEPPTMLGAFTNDDGVIDYPAFDTGDDGTDPSGLTVPGGAPRFDYDMQLCTAAVNGGSIDVVMSDTYHSAYCTVRVAVQNDTPDDLYLIDAYFDGVAPLEIALNDGSPCGYLLLPGETGSVNVDVWPVEGASGSWVKAENTIDVRWGLSGTFTCP